MRRTILIKNIMVFVAIAILSFTMYKLVTIGLMTQNGKTYQISVPYNGYSTTSFYTNKYVEKDGCVIFTDDWGKKRKICGTYEIVEY